MADDRDDQTKATEREDALAAHQADRAPTSDEEVAAERGAKRPDIAGDKEEVAEHYREMTEIGANEKGEGRVP